MQYVCSFCNACKANHRTVLDPCQSAYGQHVRVHDDGTIEGLTREGSQLIQLFRLDRSELTLFRREFLELVRLAQIRPKGETATRLRDLVRFPDDLPDLGSLRPPGGNLKANTLEDCCWAQRQRGTLPDTY